jgi:hypothetical protein
MRLILKISETQKLRLFSRKLENGIPQARGLLRRFDRPIGGGSPVRDQCRVIGIELGPAVAPDRVDSLVARDGEYPGDCGGLRRIERAALCQTISITS